MVVSASTASSVPSSAVSSSKSSRPRPLGLAFGIGQKNPLHHLIIECEFSAVLFATTLRGRGGFFWGFHFFGWLLELFGGIREGRGQFSYYFLSICEFILQGGHDLVHFIETVFENFNGFGSRLFGLNS